MPEPDEPPQPRYASAAGAGTWPATQHQQQPQPQQPQQRRPGVYLPPPPPAGSMAAPDPGLLEDHPEAGGGCSRCTSLTFNSEWLRAFGVVLCNQCKQAEALISKVG